MGLAEICAYGGKRTEISIREILTRAAKVAAGTALARPLSKHTATAPFEKLIGIKIGAISLLTIP